ncbi:sporulation protein YpjB [Bacillaceae bacterium Marseille-Q3522]|nr:sporulation protein YpjB [Bacillaceae bacterium Marseille-Q3522]
MARKIMYVILIFILLIPTAGYGEQKSPVDELELLSDEALQLTKSQRYQDAGKILDYFSKQFSTTAKNGHVLSTDEARAVTVAHQEAADAMVSTAMPHEDRMNSVTKLRLVMDAITSSHQPMWTDMEEPIMSVFAEVKAAVHDGDTQMFHVHLNSFLSLYHVIYPSVTIDIPAKQLQQIEARIRYLDHYRPKIISNAEGMQELEALETDLQSMFDQVTEDEADPSLWWVIISTGGIIISTLSYVGWRKYKGERQKQKKRS